MRLTYMIGALVALASASPAMAQSFEGPRIEATIGGGDVNRVIDKSDTNYGAAVGYDFAVAPKVRVGIEANTDNVFDRDRTYGVQARAGYVLARKLLVYGAVGYEDFNQLTRRQGYRSLDGFRYGGGVEMALTRNVFAKAEFRRTELGGGISKEVGLVGGGLRF